MKLSNPDGYIDIGLVGRANVGKSTIFNCLVKSRDALVLDYDGLTRDRKSRTIIVGDYKVNLHDLCGVDFDLEDSIEKTENKLDISIQELTKKTIKRCQLLLFVVDGRLGLHPYDSKILSELHKYYQDAKLLLVINKSEFSDQNCISAPFFELGIDDFITISAEHRIGIDQLKNYIFKMINGEESIDFNWEPMISEYKVVILGKPNVGKSTLMNKLLNMERVLVNNVAGTTIESINELKTYKDVNFQLTDTAGIRNKSSIPTSAKIENLGVSQAIKSAKNATVVLFIIEVVQLLTLNDLRILRKLFTIGKPIILVINKLDTISDNDYKRLEEQLSIRLNFAPYIKKIFISAKLGKGINKLWVEIYKIPSAINQCYGTAKLNRQLKDWVENKPPSFVKKTNKRPKIKYIHQVCSFPLKFEIICNQVLGIDKNYKKYIEKCLRRDFNLPDIPIIIIWKENDNPYINS